MSRKQVLPATTERSITEQSPKERSNVAQSRARIRIALAEAFCRAGRISGHVRCGPPGDPRDWLAGIAAGVLQEDRVSRRPDGQRSPGSVRAFTPEETNELQRAARFAAAALAVVAARDTLRAALDAYLGRRSAARVLAPPLRRGSEWRVSTRDRISLRRVRLRED